MRKDTFELTEALLPENPLEGLDPEPDVLANITARARARRRGEPETAADGAVAITEDQQAAHLAATPATDDQQNFPPIMDASDADPATVADSGSQAAGAVAWLDIPLPEIDMDDPDLMSGTHATTLRADWELIQSLKRMARDLSRPRKECTMGMLILHALKQTYPDLFRK
jgi:hypothetical protein